MKHILIIGAGIGGVSAALRLVRKAPHDSKITLVNPTSHLEYHAILYRVLTGHSPMEASIQLADIFKGYDVELVEDTIDHIDFAKRVARGTSDSRYHYDYCIIALGSETSYFDTPGLAELSFTVKSVASTIRLNRHMHEAFSQCALTPDTGEKKCNTHIVVVGGGATGVEVAGALAEYAKKLARGHGVDETLVQIELVTSPDRLIPDLPAEVSSRVKKRLESLGVRVTLKSRVLKEEIEAVHLKDVTMRTKTVVWAAGVKGHSRLAAWGLPVEKSGKVTVDEYLKVKNIYVIGDAAATRRSGLAKTAWYDGRYAADSIRREMGGQSPVPYKPVRIEHFVPVGSGWAATVIGPMKFYGFLGWMTRRFMDLIFFLLILPPGRALEIFRQDNVYIETCEICKKKQ